MLTKARAMKIGCNNYNKLEVMFKGFLVDT